MELFRPKQSSLVRNKKTGLNTKSYNINNSMKVEREVTYVNKILFIMIFNNGLEIVAKEEHQRQHLCGNNMLDRASQLNAVI